MSSKSQKLIREFQLGPDFAEGKVSECRKLIDRNISFTLIAMPGVGATVFLRYLTTLPIAYFVFVDTYSLSNINKLEFFKLVLSQLGGKIKKEVGEDQILEECRKKLLQLSENNQKIVIIFNRFDQLKRLYDNQFFANIASLRNVRNDSIMFIFSSNKPYSQTLNKFMDSYHYNMLSKTVYLQPFSNTDLGKILKMSKLVFKLPKSLINKALELSAGHNQLLQLYLKSEAKDPLLQDRFLKFQLKELYDFLNYHQKKTLQNIALGKPVSDIDPYLINIGLVKRNGQTYRLFTPLLTSYLKNNVPFKLPVKESKLFKLLLRNIDLLVTKDQIFKTVWEKDSENATNWALDALIYRLRKNPGFKVCGYVIENIKKQGYMLIKS